MSVAADPRVLAARLAVDDAGIRVEFGGVTVTVPVTRWVAVATLARDELGLRYFDMLCGVDESDTEAGGFSVVAHVYDHPGRARLLLRTVVPAADPRLPTLTGVWRGAAWHEREAAEMYGLVFEGHPNLVPLLLPDGFGAHPLRKDFVLAARAAKAWPGAKEPGEDSTRRPALAPGQPGHDAGWPRPLATETIRPTAPEPPPLPPARPERPARAERPVRAPAAAAAPEAPAGRAPEATAGPAPEATAGPAPEATAGPAPEAPAGPAPETAT